MPPHCVSLCVCVDILWILGEGTARGAVLNMTGVEALWVHGCHTNIEGGKVRDACWHDASMQARVMGCLQRGVQYACMKGALQVRRYLCIAGNASMGCTCRGARAWVLYVAGVWRLECVAARESGVGARCSGGRGV